MHHVGNTSYSKNSGIAVGEGGDKPKKRIRRTANQINRRFICMCGKAYGSEGSLNQHRKNKGHFEDADAIKVTSPNAVSRQLQDVMEPAALMHADNVSGVSSSREHTDM